MTTRTTQDYDALRNEYQICRRKLDSKCEALQILSNDLDRCRQERDQFKLMAEQVQARYQGMKRQLAGVGPRQIHLDGVEFADMKQQNLAQLLCEMREVTKSLQFENDDLKHKLQDAQGDIKLLREQVARQRLGSMDEGMNMRHFPAHEREDLVQQLEAAQCECTQMERDLQQVLDEKEEYVTERDVYKNKYERLNNELNYVLKGDEKRIVDIDAMNLENKYLQERVKQLEEEKNMAMSTVTKYKSILEKKKSKGIIKLGQSRSGGVVISQKQVHQLLETRSVMTPTPQMMADLQSVSSALLETLNDKNLALSHQRKTNKILGSRVSELENKLKTLEVSGLWNIPQAERVNSLQKLKKEFEELQTLVPPASYGGEAGDGGDTLDHDDLKPSKFPAHFDPGTLVADSQQRHQATTMRTKNSSLQLEELDFLPTKDSPSAAHGSLLAEFDTGLSATPAVADTSLRSPQGAVTFSTEMEAGIGASDQTLDQLPVEEVEGNGLDEAESDDELDPQDLQDLLEQATNRCLEQATNRCLEQAQKSVPPQVESVENSTSSMTSPGCSSPLLGSDATLGEEDDVGCGGHVIS